MPAWMTSYDVINDSAAVVLDAKWKPADWSAVADELAGRLKKLPAGGDDSWQRNYERDRLSGWLLTALENAGREGELLAIYESEARATGSYERLVKHLIAEKRFDDAERWAKEGIEKTREKLPGIASSLAASLCEVSRGRKQWDIVTAHAAWQFFERPARMTSTSLWPAAKAKCGEQVRAAALRFLETGVSPFQWIASSKAGQTLRVDSAWPLPLPNYLLPLLRTGGRAAAPAGRTTTCCSTWPSPPSSRTKCSAGTTKCPGSSSDLAADGVLPGAGQMIVWPPQSPSPIPNGLWKSIGGGWMEPCRTPTSRPTNRRQGISGRCNRSEIPRPPGRMGRIAGRHSGKIPQPPAIYGNSRQARRPHNSPSRKKLAAAGNEGPQKDLWGGCGVSKPDARS